MIATNEAVDVLRHGWQDAASTLAADVPEVAELLQARLEMAITSQRLDEIHLLETIQEVESVTSRAGSPSGQALARRLRRTVYEYLLALDAARPLETTKVPVDQPARAQDSAMVGAEEVAALGHASRTRAGDEADIVDAAGAEAAARASTFAKSDEPDHQLEGAVAGESADAASVDAQSPAGADAPPSRRRFALRRRQRQGADATEVAEPVIDLGSVDPDPAVAPHTDAAEPNWQFTPPAEPAVFDSDLDADPADAPPPAAPVESADTPGEPTPTFVAPRAGFHIVEDAPPHRADQEEARLQMPAFTADEANAAQGQSGGTEAVASEPPATLPPLAPENGQGDAGSDFLAWRAPTPSSPPTHDQSSVPPEVATSATEQPVEADSPAEPLTAPADTVPDTAESAMPVWAPVSQPPVVTPAQVAPTTPAPADDEDGESRGWGVRKHGEAHAPRRGVPAIAVASVEDDPFENNTRLSDMRRRVEERLRRKRCDEAAALLQEIAQETGGRAVAELAMNVGDRCRALGKSNAALNCYLAAARSDPVYELPLSRLADICIDNQDTELAVSYLERIARIYRFREEDRAALRTYRRIATIAPYREDVLTLLMNAQRTGQLQ